MTTNDVCKILEISYENQIFINSIKIKSFPVLHVDKTQMQAGFWKLSELDRTELTKFCEYCEFNSLWDKVEGYYKVKYLLK